MNPEYIFTSANVVFTIGTFLLFLKVVKNRNMLNDFDVVGSGLTAIALVLMVAGFIYISMYISVLFMLPTLAFWVFVTVYSMKKYKE